MSRTSTAMQGKKKLPTTLDLGYAVPPAERTGRGPYHKGRGADKGSSKGKEKFPSNWPPLNPGPPKGLTKGFPMGIPKGLAKAPDKGK